MMYIGAVIIAAGCGSAPMLPAGGISVAQRMVAAFQKAGVDLIALVTGPEDKKLEKQLAQPGLVFLHNETPEDRLASRRLGLEYLRGKCQRIFLTPADRPLIAPETVSEMLEAAGDVIIPTCEGAPGQPILLSGAGIDCFEAQSEDRLCVPVLHRNGLVVDYISVEDPGILLSAEAGCSQTEALSEHDRKLTRPVLEFAVSRGRNLLDRKLMVLLYLIRDTQSVRDACSRMQISYSTAWNMLNAAENELGYPLLLRNKGGPSGTGSLLTRKGQALLNAYEQFESAAKMNMEKLYDTYLRDLL
ncbi:MAG: NTP transferase domain-containing protein [Oscillospiraceae bacterium]|nr:NTP transferase domain-containing protein [Oscillospiraceae bacterium]